MASERLIRRLRDGTELWALRDSYWTDDDQYCRGALVQCEREYDGSRWHHDIESLLAIAADLAVREGDAVLAVEIDALLLTLSSRSTTARRLEDT